MRIVFSPHLDDAFISLGGAMLAWKEKKEDVGVVYVFSITNWMKGKPDKNPETVTAIIKDEVSKNLDATGIGAQMLDIPEIMIRSPSTKERHGEKARVDIVAEAEIFDFLEEVIMQIVEQGGGKDQLYFPLGIGNHIDHIILRAVAIDLVNSGKLDKKNVFFYDDLPFYPEHPTPGDIIIDQRLTSELIDIKKQLKKKIELISGYKNLSSANPKLLEECAKSYVDKGCNERVWKYK
ncbi:MAG: PIG-L family deacetylase [Candidatus Diapherotrites archaeon]|nr:PIG-L family deacetylase [Candidatus Diapherotrites archaeon]